MGFEILLFEEGDQLKYEIFVITGDHSWKPSLYHEEADEDEEAEMNAYNNTIVVDKDHFVRHFFDPENQEILVVGNKVQVAFDPHFVKFQLAKEAPTKANAVATWHRVITKILTVNYLDQI